MVVLSVFRSLEEVDEQQLDGERREKRWMSYRPGWEGFTKPLVNMAHGGCHLLQNLGIENSRVLLCRCIH